MSDIKSMSYHRTKSSIRSKITTAELYDHICKLHEVVSDLLKTIEIQDTEIKLINNRLIKLGRKDENDN